MMRWHPARNRSALVLMLFALAVLVPAGWISVDRTVEPVLKQVKLPPIRPVPLGATPSSDRALFDPMSGTDVPQRDKDGPPALLGIVGRMSADAVALVRTQDGAVRTVTIGSAVDGWLLEAVAPDAALFTAGGRKMRIDLPLS